METSRAIILIGADKTKRFDNIFPESEGYSVVKKNNKYNAINGRGDIVFSSWYNYLSECKDGNFVCKVKGKFNRIDVNTGRYVYDDWFENARFCEITNRFILLNE